MTGAASSRIETEDDEHDHPDPDQDVADREDVGQRQLGREREHVAEEAESRRAYEDVLVHTRREAVGPGGARRDRHQPVVGDDRRGVRHQAEQHRDEYAQAEVGRREREQEHVARHVQPLDRDLVEPFAELAEDDQLQDERDRNRPCEPEAHVGEPARPAAEEHGEDDSEDEAGEEEHLGRRPDRRRELLGGVRLGLCPPGERGLELLGAGLERQ